MQAPGERIPHPLIDFRLYRLSFGLALLAVVVAMFSLEGTPDAIEAAASPGFEDERAAIAARQVLRLAPDRRPGSPGDDAVADLVAERFAEVAAGAVSEQLFEAEFEGEELELRNVLLTLPGDTASTVVVFAPRDSARGSGAASSAAATGALIELAEALGNRERRKAFLLASTTGSEAGAAGARALVSGLPERESIEAVIAITQPGAAERSPPFVVSSSTSETSGPVQLERTAEQAISAQAEEDSSDPSAFGQLARLAIPSGLGPQAPLIAEGFDAVAISAAGERPLEESEDGLDQLSGETLDAFGRAVESTVFAVDESTEPLVHGPGTHLELSGNLVPGWTIALLALGLILPAVVVAVDACARAARGRMDLGPSVAWAAARSVPFVGALLALYGLAIVGAVPRPAFPFDPGLHEFGTRAAISLAVVVLVGIASAALLRRRGVTAAVAPAAAAPAIGLVAAVACLLIWLANPYLALLLVPAAHAWLLAAAGEPTASRGALAVAATGVAAAPAVAALATISGALDLGAGAPWTFALMVADGQIGLGVTVPACFVGGALLGAIALCLSSGRVASGEADRIRGSAARPSSHR
ncbi:MAG: hypothetical protein K0R88_2478 [Solirubrobacterales bacterium]|jgi:hypothetical protein|nr:hypothetical protein [Solirubrobacterales bacterium]